MRFWHDVVEYVVMEAMGLSMILSPQRNARGVIAHCKINHYNSLSHLV